MEKSPGQTGHQLRFLRGCEVTRLRGCEGERWKRWLGTTIQGTIQVSDRGSEGATGGERENWGERRTGGLGSGGG